ncbi:hypothetical protein FACS1894133_4900 [Clostridia bacterium]|nr:hypothetical protein FACS1894133_4900 [Clostridia bacterium]
MEENEKIAAFRDSVRVGIERKISGVVEEAERQSKIIIENAEDQFLRHSYDVINRRSKIIKSVSRRRVATANTEAKRETLKRRNDLVGEFFAGIRANVVEFTKSRGYSTFIEAKLIRVNAEKPVYNWTRIMVREQDLPLAQSLTAKYEGLHAEIDNGIKVGGFILFYPKEKQYIDMTLDKSLQTARENFIYNAELMLPN